MQPRGLSEATSYLSNRKVITQGGKPNDEHGDLFAKDRNQHHVIPTSPWRYLELPTKSQH
jgi:hypothetical protein